MTGRDANKWNIERKIRQKATCVSSYNARMSYSGQYCSQKWHVDEKLDGPCLSFWVLVMIVMIVMIYSATQCLLYIFGVFI